jgi:glycosyltransferase involved in cell wall biosynthesis
MTRSIANLLRFCYSRDLNDHPAYPLSAARDASLGWRYRPAEIRLDPDRGRPWAHFDARPGEIIHASSLLPTNSSPWIFDTDHAEYLIAQALHDQGTCFEDRDELERAIARSLCSPWCRGIFAWSEAARQSLLELFARHQLPAPDVRVVYPAVLDVLPDGDANAEGVLDREVLDELERSLAPGHVRLLAVDGQRGVCRHEGRKNLSDAVECFRVLRQAGHPVEIILVGPTEPIAPQPGLWVLPPVSPSGMRRLFRLADVLLFLSRQDSFGMVLLEALAAGLACVASRAASLVAVPELISDGVNGFLVPFLTDRPYPHLSDQLDLSKLIATVGRLVASPGEQARIAARAHADFAPGGRFSVQTRNRRLTGLLATSPSTVASVRPPP